MESQDVDRGSVTLETCSEQKSGIYSELELQKKNRTPCGMRLCKVISYET